MAFRVIAVMSDGVKLAGEGRGALDASSALVDAIQAHRASCFQDEPLPFPVCVKTRGLAQDSAFADLLTVYQLAMSQDVADSQDSAGRASGRSELGGLSL